MIWLLLGCSDYGFQIAADELGGGAPEIQVEPLALDFWSLEGGASRTLSFTVRNVGEAVLDVDDLALSGDADFSLGDQEVEFTLEPETSREIDVTFSPLGSGARVGEVLVLSTDEDEPEIPVSLAGEGLVPWLEITPELHDFGAIEIPCGDAVQLVLQNVGGAELTIEGAALSDPQFALRDPDALPGSLAPGAYTTAWVDLTAATPGDVESALTVYSNDPRGEVTALQTASPQLVGVGADDFVVEDAAPVSVLFAVDQSCSMDDDAARLAAGFSEFIEAVGEATAGWRVAAVTYDDGCANGGVLTAETDGYEAIFTAAVAAGEDREIINDEALFQIVDRALQGASAGGCNEGLLQPGGPLHVIVVSDEPERSTEVASAWTWDYWVGRLEGYVDAGALLKISGVVDTEGCSEGADGYLEAIEATGGEALSICTEDWAGYAAALADASLSYVFTFPLSQEPAPETLEVLVDGEPVTEGWVWDESLNAVVFDHLEPGQEVSVSYSLAGACE